MMDTMILIPTVLLVLNEGLKRLFNMPSKWAIVINWVGGLLLGAIFIGVAPQDLVMGFLLGSSAAGIYDGKKLTQ